MDGEAGERLPGGNLGGAVRVGDTVRKPAGRSTPAIHSLLQHLEQAGLEGAPRSLGVDEQDRHVLGYLEGETVGDHEPWPSWCWSDETAVEVAGWLRRYHDTVASFVPPPDADWRYRRELRPGWVVCHNDIAPYNVVWRDGLVGLIDWDIASPGDPHGDVAQAAWQFAPLHHTRLAEALGADPRDALRRVRLLLDSYGIDDRAPFVDLIPERIEASIAGIEHEAKTDAAFARLAAEHLPDVRATLVHVRSLRPSLVEALA